MPVVCTGHPVEEHQNVFGRATFLTAQQMHASTCSVMGNQQQNPCCEAWPHAKPEFRNTWSVVGGLKLGQSFLVFQ